MFTFGWGVVVVEEAGLLFLAPGGFRLPISGALAGFFGGGAGSSSYSAYSSSPAGLANDKPTRQTRPNTKLQKQSIHHKMYKTTKCVIK